MPTLTPAQLETFRAYAIADNTYGLAAAYTAKNGANIVTIANWIRDGSTVCPANSIAGAQLKVRVPTVPAMAIIDVIARADLLTTAVTPLDAALLGSILNNPNMPNVQMLQADGLTPTVTLANLKTLVPGATSNAAIVALAKPSGSIIQSLFGSSQQPINSDDAEAILELTS